MATVDAAARLADGGSGVVVGVDLCGNPARGDFATYVPALQRARAAGLRVTLHLGELDRPREVAEMLDFGPDRVGHACFLDAAAWARVRAGRVPLEACVTSNLRTASVASANTHHALELVRAGHPVAICTDDPGVFGRSAREEHELVRAALGYDGRQMAALGARVLAEGCFLSTRDQDVRAALIRRFRAIADGER
jgi:adenosine deaminase